MLTEQSLQVLDLTALASIWSMFNKFRDSSIFALSFFTYPLSLWIYVDFCRIYVEVSQVVALDVLPQIIRSHALLIHEVSSFLLFEKIVL